VLYFGARYVQQPFQGPEQLTAIWAVPLILLSVGLAAATYKWIENPFRHAAFIKNSGLKSLVFGLSLSFVVVLIATLVSTQVMRQQAGGPATGIQADEISNVANPEAVAKIVAELAPKHVASDADPLDPDQIVSAQDDFPDSYENGCHAEDDQGLVPENCTFGSLDSKTHVYLFGNSHANMFFTPIRDSAVEQGLKLTSRTRTACSISDVTFLVGNSEYVACNAWRDAVVAEIKREIPKLVLISSSQHERILDPVTGIRATPDRAKELYVQGVQSIMQEFSDLGIKVILIRDTPRLRESPLDCLSAYLPEGCQYSVTESVNDPAFSTGAVSNIPGVLPADLTLALCGTATCESVRSGTIVWRDSHHLTDAYAQELTPMFSELLKLQLGPQ
jgi:hypothetical protein